MAASIGRDVARAAEILRQGGLVAFPTETVYGLGAHALNPTAVARVFEAKGRPWFDPLIVHIADRSQVATLATDFPPVAIKLADRFWPGPLSLVVPKTPQVPDLVTSGLPDVAVRCPDHPIARELLRESGLPLAGPSANLFGRISPTTAEHVAEQLGDRVDYILDGGPCRVGVESTVLHITPEGVRLLRPGGVPLEDIERLIGPVLRPQTSETEAQPQAGPGMLLQHYAPRTPLVIDGNVADLAQGRRVGVLAFRAPQDVPDGVALEVLSPIGDLREAAAGFFAALRRLDAQQLDLLIGESFPEEGLGRALNDRLKRAASKS
ncbi:MAG TPA: L-threonylcarbamoyladenylate synthase [Planctomycetaceae bacterium]|nr:L-threonylcarbamoyladenylate synthase [Planctomycetaceae bacterium]